ncbi:MAG: alanine racemase [Pseudonocardia sp.]
MERPLLPDRVVTALRSVPAPVCAYVYDRALLLDRVRLVRSCLPPGASLLYAVKANGHPDLLAAVAPSVDGFEVASGGELALALAAGAESVMFAGPAKTDDELCAAVRAGATVNVESEFELRRLSLLAADAGASAEVGLRVNRPVPISAGVTHRMTGRPTQFGIPEVDLPALVDLASRLPGVRLRGLHLHAVSNNLDADAHVAFVTDALDWAVATGLNLDHVNVGGGFGIDYLRSRSFDVSLLKSIVVPAGLRLIFEPGRFLVAPAGWYAAEVVDLKRSHGRWFAVVRGGTHHFRLPAAWGYSHPFSVLPVDDWPYPFTRPVVADVEIDVAGELCTPRDILARDTWTDRLRIGDLLVFADTGAYGWEISHHDFLAHPYPAMIVL